MIKQVPSKNPVSTKFPAFQKYTFFLHQDIKFVQLSAIFFFWGGEESQRVGRYTPSLPKQKRRFDTLGSMVTQFGIHISRYFR